jgi:hypothetical protein
LTLISSANPAKASSCSITSHQRTTSLPTNTASWCRTTRISTLRNGVSWLKSYTKKSGPNVHTKTVSITTMLPNGAENTKANFGNRGLPGNVVERSVVAVELLPTWTGPKDRERMVCPCLLLILDDLGAQQHPNLAQWRLSSIRSQEFPFQAVHAGRLMPTTHKRRLCGAERLRRISSAGRQRICHLPRLPWVHLSRLIVRTRTWESRWRMISANGRWAICPYLCPSSLWRTS